MNRIGFWAAVSAALLALPLVEAHAGNPASAKEGRQTLDDLHGLAIQVENDADQLRSIARNPQLDVALHAEKLGELKEEINRMGRDMKALSAEESALPPWEREAIDRTLPLLKDSASNAERAIAYLNANQTHAWAGTQYRDYAERIYDDSRSMARTLGDYLKMARLRREERQLNETMGAMGQ